MRSYILLGGFAGPDGYIDSAPFLQLSPLLAPYGRVQVFDWLHYPAAAQDMMANTAQRAIFGFSGGGSRALMLAAENPKLTIDLAVLYDPSPWWQTRSPCPTNIKRCVVYQNKSPMFFGLGGGKTAGPNVTVVPIAEEHMFVQADQALHARTMKEVHDLASAAV